MHKTTAETRSVSARLLLQSASDLIEQIKLHIADNGNLSVNNAAACKTIFDREIATLTHKMRLSVGRATGHSGLDKFVRLQGCLGSVHIVCSLMLAAISRVFLLELSSLCNARLTCL